MKGRQYGGFWRRFFAYLIDQIILYFVSLILFLVGLLALGMSGDPMDWIPAFSLDPVHGTGVFTLLYLTASLIAGMMYFTWFHGITGRTPGKMLLGLRVIQASGDPMTPGIAFLRWVGYLISGPLLGLGFLWIAFDGRKQGWHDKIAATLVIRERSGYDPDACKEFNNESASRTTTLADSAVATPPSAGEPQTFIPPPEDQEKKPQIDGFLPRP